VNNIIDERKLLLRIALMARQFGNLAGAITQYIRQTDRLDASLEFIETELADIIHQSYRLSRDLKLDYFKLEEMGLKRYQECKKEFEDRGEEWI